MKHKLTNFLLTALGCALIIWSVGRPLLGIFGEQALGQITSIRRQGGERDEAIRGRYTYAIGFEFTLPSGQVIFGSTTRVGNYYQAYALPSVNAAPVRYLRAVPAVNALEVDTRLSVEYVIVFLTGGALIFRDRLGRDRSKKHKKPNVRRSKRRTGSQ